MPIHNGDGKEGIPSLTGDNFEEKFDLKKIINKYLSATFIVKVNGISIKDAFVSDPWLTISYTQSKNV